ncbi:hypothetical protein KIN20_032194 [Parelaphostrongylus tenuis]|uniref:Uncharacterized protein n=1 Tax=Parelaphostrongylus tenuis TaxID=148309 RepID=A0AAD5R691_PARTN|nr:hypothetical protein KIN20_032194 [Parelaphostrongylus tenuis]
MVESKKVGMDSNVLLSLHYNVDTVELSQHLNSYLLLTKTVNNMLVQLLIVGTFDDIGHFVSILRLLSRLSVCCFYVAFRNSLLS